MSDEANGTGAPAESPAVTPEQDAVDYKAKFTGLNKAHQRVLTEYNEFKGQYAAIETQANTFKTQAEELSKVKAALEAERDALKAAREQAEQEAATSKRSLARMQTISQFPELAEYEAKGFLRVDLEGDQLTGYLTEFRQTLVGQKKAAVQEQLKGALPNAGAPQGNQDAELSIDVLREQHQKAMNEQNWPEVDRLWNLYLQRLTKPAQ